MLKTMVGGSSSNPFITQWKTDNAGTSTNVQITVPTVAAGTYNCVVDWGDNSTSTITTFNDAAWTHTYPAAGTYVVTIRGTFTGFRFAGGGDRLKILKVQKWGNVRFANQTQVFSACANLTITATDIPNFTGSTTLANFFQNCTSITSIPGFNSWNFVGINSFSSFMAGCSSFNQDISGWNMSTASNMNGMFSSCVLFNAPIGSWNTANVNSMQTTLSGCIAFNQSLNAWNTSNVSNMLGTFSGATSYNQSMSNWNTALVTTFSQFLQNATSFNQSLSNFNTALVTSMANMFMGATSFNQPLTNFNTANVVNMQNMFSGATAFNQNIGSWNITKLAVGGTGGTNMFLGVTLSNANYNGLLAGWGAQVPLTGVTFSGGNSHYDAVSGGFDGTAGRAVLTGTYSWTITDGGTP